MNNSLNRNEGVRMGQVNYLGRAYGNPYEILRRAGFDCTDVGAGPGSSEEEVFKSAERETSEIRNYGLEIVCFHSIFLKPWCPVKDNIDLQRPQLRCARIMGARFFLVHALWENLKCFDLDSAAARRKQLDFDVRTLMGIAGAAAEYELRLVVENNPGFPHDYYLELIENLPPERCGAILDTGHANIQPEGRSRPVWELIQKLGKRLEHLHLNDNDGIADQHLPVLSPIGKIDWKKVFKALKTAEYAGVLNEELPPMTGIAWTAWSLLERTASPLRELWHNV